VVGDVSAFAEISLEQTLFHLVAQAPRLGQLHQTMRIEGIGHHGLAEIVDEPHLRRRRGQAFMVLADLIQGPALLFRQVGFDAFAGFGGHVRIELEALPGDFRFGLQARVVQGFFQPALSQVAEGAHDVRPNFDFHDTTARVDGIQQDTLCRPARHAPPAIAGERR
jgi:hypothetical protein